MFIGFTPAVAVNGLQALDSEWMAPEENLAGSEFLDWMRSKGKLSSAGGHAYVGGREGAAAFLAGLDGPTRPSLGLPQAGLVALADYEADFGWIGGDLKLCTVSSSFQVIRYLARQLDDGSAEVLNSPDLEHPVVRIQRSTRNHILMTRWGHYLTKDQLLSAAMQLFGASLKPSEYTAAVVPVIYKRGWMESPWLEGLSCAGGQIKYARHFVSFKLGDAAGSRMAPRIQESPDVYELRENVVGLVVRNGLPSFAFYTNQGSWRLFT